MTDWGIILERREELQTGKIKREGRMTGCVQIKKKTAKEAKLMKKTTATQQSYFSPHNLLFPVSWPWAWWQEWVSHVQSDPPILSLA